MHNFDDDIVETRDLFNEDISEIEESENVPSFFDRILVFALICLIVSVSSLCQDNLVPFQNEIVEHMKLSEVQYNAISSFYSIPNIILVFFGGILVDKIGHRLSTIIFISIVFLGQALLCVSVYRNIYGLLILSRFIFGVGSESLQISITKYCVLWFKGGKLNLAMGSQLAFGRVTTFLYTFFAQHVYQYLVHSLMNYEKIFISTCIISIGAVFSGICILLSILCCIIDKKYKLEDKEKNKVDAKFSFRNFKLSISQLSPTFWILCVFVFFVYLPSGSYGTILPLYMELKYDIDEQYSNKILSLVYFSQIFAFLIFGFLTGYIGYDVIWYYIGTFILFLIHTFYCISFIYPWIYVIFRGIGSSIIACSFWPSIKFVVPITVIGIAYGIIQSIQNFGLSISPFIIAYIIECFGYYWLELYIILCFSITLCVIGAIYLIDNSYTSGILMTSTFERNANYLASESFQTNDTSSGFLE